MLSQLDVDFELTYTRLLNAYRGFINGWFAETDKPVVVDKNRGWLRMVDTVKLLDPEFRMVVCIRDLRQVFGSIEGAASKDAAAGLSRPHLTPLRLRAGRHAV